MDKACERSRVEISAKFYKQTITIAVIAYPSGHKAPDRAYCYLYCRGELDFPEVSLSLLASRMQRIGFPYTMEARVSPYICFLRHGTNAKRLPCENGLGVGADLGKVAWRPGSP
jgi:hypothetical protein